MSAKWLLTVVLLLPLGAAGCGTSGNTPIGPAPQATTPATVAAMPGTGDNVKHVPPEQSKTAKTRVTIWDLAANKELAVFEDRADPDDKSVSKESSAAKQPILAVACSTDGTYLASAGSSGPLELWQAATLKAHKTLAGSPPLTFASKAPRLAFGTEKAAALCLALDPDGGLLAIGGDGIKVVDAATGKQLAHFKDVHKERVRAVAFSPDGQRLASAAGAEVALWDVSGRKHLFTAKLPGYNYSNGPINFSITPNPSLLAFTPDGKTVLAAATSSGFPLVTFCPVDKEKPPANKVFELPTGISSFEALAFSPDAKYLAAVHLDGQLRIWDLPAGQLLQQFPDEGKVVSHTAHALAFSPDGRTLFAGCTDGTLRRWEVAKLLKK
jgi:WD40 repeat protein